MKRIMQTVLMLGILTSFAVANDMVPYSFSLSSGPSDAQVYLPGSTEAIDNCGAGPFLYVEIQGIGTMTHMGLVTDIQHHCVNVITNLFFNGAFTFTSIDGTKLTGTYTGYMEPTATGMIIHGDVVLTGGTGRFATATGTGTALGAQRFDANGQFAGAALTAHGMISSVGSSHK